MTGLLSNPAIAFTVAALLMVGFGAVTVLLIQRYAARTERAQARAALAQHLLGALDDGPPWLLFLDGNGIVIQASHAFATAFGFTPAALTGQNAVALLEQCGADHAQALRLEAARRAGQGFRLTLNTPDGNRRFLLIGQPWRQHGQSAYWLLGVEVTVELEEQDDLARLAYRDDVTGLPNLAWLRRTATATNGEQTMLHISFPGFTALDPVQANFFMAAAADRLTKTIDQGTLAIRAASDALALVVSGDGIAVAETLAEKLGAACSSPQTTLQLCCAIGLAPFTGSITIDTALADAERAGRRLRLRGRSAIARFDAAEQDDLRQRHALEEDLRRAIHLAPDELAPAYQPIHRLDGGALAGAELLARWHHPRLGDIAPADFIPMAEDSGLIGALWAQLFTTGCRTLKTWQRTAPGFFLSVNLSARQLSWPGLAAMASLITDLTGVSPGTIKLELTDTSFPDDAAAARAQLLLLKGRGFAISADGFATSVAPVFELQHLPLTDAKIDRAFVRDLHSGPAGLERVSAIARFASALGCTLTAEGIESAADVELLRSYGCAFGQGFLFGKPVNAAAFTNLLVRPGLPRVAPVPVS